MVSDKKVKKSYVKANKAAAERDKVVKKAKKTAVRADKLTQKWQRGQK